MSASRLRVAHFAPMYLGQRGILETKLRALGTFAEIEPILITPPTPAGLTVIPTRVKHVTVPMIRAISPLRDIGSLWTLTRLLRGLRPDVLHTHGAKPGFLGACAGRLAGVPRVFHTYHGLPFFAGQRAFPRRCYHLLERIACRYRSYAFSQNRLELPLVASMIGSDRCELEGNGVDVGALREERARHRISADELWLPGSSRLLVISRLEPVKRLHDFITVMHRLEETGKPVSALIVGPGPLRNRLERMARRLGVDSRLRLLGWRNDVCALIDAADVVVLCSEKEGIPRSLMEAMALGKPVVATSVTGTEELVVDEVTGYLTPLGATESMARRISELIERPELRAKMGAAAARRIEDCFDDRKIAARWRELYVSRSG